MAFTVATLKDDIEAQMHGTTLNKVQGVDALINRAGRQVLMDVDPQETKRLMPIANAIYDDVKIYTAPVDLKGDKIIDIRPQLNRSAQRDNFTKVHNEIFDLKKAGNTFSLEHRDSVKFLRLSKELTTGVTIHKADSITDNGTWAVGDDATNLTRDTLNFVGGNAALNFDLNGAGTTAFIENSTMDAVDLTDHEDVGALFLFVYLPNASAITDVTLRWGSSTSDYWSVTVTAPHVGTAFQNGWNLLRFDWNGAAVTGSPTVTAVDTLRVALTYDGTADTDIRVDNIVSRLGEIWETLYYSKYLFRTSAGVWGEEVTADSDSINLDTDSYNLLVFKGAEFAAQQQQGEDGPFDLGYFQAEYTRGVDRYQRMYKSEVEKTKSSYYTPQSRRFKV